VVLLLAGTSAAGWHLVTTARLKRQLRVAEQARTLEHERLRIAQDLHDQLGANLTTITLLSEVARREASAPDKVEDHLRNISGTARDLTRALEEIVWAVNPRKDKLDQMVAYFSAYAEEFLKPTDLRCRLDFPDELPERVVPSEVRHPLFLILKEALTNIVKHAAASEVHISLDIADSKLRLAVEDNGSGFDPSQVRNGANGLANMRTRVAKHGGTCDVISQAGRGTRIQVEIALAQAETHA
jgi:signal transduction histidine kinase